MFGFLRKFTGQLMIGVLAGAILLTVFCFYLFRDIQTVSDINKETAAVYALPRALAAVQITFSDENARIFALEKGEISVERFNSEFKEIEKREDAQFSALESLLNDLQNSRRVILSRSEKSGVMEERVSLMNQKRQELESAMDDLARAYDKNDPAMEDAAKEKVSAIYDFFNKTTASSVQEADAVVERQSAYFRSAIDATLRSLVLFVILILTVMGVINAYVILFASRSLGVILDGIKKFDEGDLAHKIPLKSRNEFGVIASTLNLAIDHIKESRDESEEAKSQLARKVSELEKFKRLTIGREMKMIELKKEIDKLTKMTR